MLSKELCRALSSMKTSSTAFIHSSKRDKSIGKRIKEWHDRKHAALRHDYQVDATKAAIQNVYKLRAEKKGSEIKSEDFYSQARVDSVNMSQTHASSTNTGDIISPASPGGVVYRHFKAESGKFSQDKLDNLLRNYEENIMRSKIPLTPSQEAAKAELLKAHTVPDPFELKRIALGKQPIGNKQSAFSRWLRATFPEKSKPKTSTQKRRAAKSSGLSSILRQQYVLAKPNVSLMVMTTAWWSYGLSCGFMENFDWIDFSALSVGTLGLAISASIINQIRETDVDAKMSRTAARPLVTGKISIKTAKLLTVAYGATGAAILAAVNPYAALLGILNVGLYGGIYTSLKRKSPLNTEIGAIVGMVPPVMGYLVGIPEGAPLLHDPIALFWPAAMMLAWQIQHVMLICIRRAEDYNRSGLVMQCLNDGELAVTRAKGVSWAIATAGISALPLLYGWADITHIMLIYMWGVYAAMFAVGALSKQPRMSLLKVCLYLGYLFLFITIIFSFATRKYEEDFSKIQLNKKRKPETKIISIDA